MSNNIYLTLNAILNQTLIKTIDSKITFYISHQSKSFQASISKKFYFIPTNIFLPLNVIFNQTLINIWTKKSLSLNKPPIKINQYLKSLYFLSINIFLTLNVMTNFNETLIKHFNIVQISFLHIMSYGFSKKNIFFLLDIQPNLSTTATLGTPKKRPLFKG